MTLKAPCTCFMKSLRLHCIFTGITYKPRVQWSYMNVCLACCAWQKYSPALELVFEWQSWPISQAIGGDMTNAFLNSTSCSHQIAQNRRFYLFFKFSRRKRLPNEPNTTLKTQKILWRSRKAWKRQIWPNKLHQHSRLTGSGLV